MDNETTPTVYRLRPLGLIPLIALGLLSTLATGGGGGGDGGGPVTPVTNTPPQISNLQLSQDSVDFLAGGGTILIQAQLTYTDPEADVVNVRVEVSDGTSLTVPVPSLPGSSGTIVGAVSLSTSVSGTFQAEVWVVDQRGNESNRLTTTFTVLGGVRLTDLSLSTGSFDQIFQSSLNDYTATVRFLIASTSVTATTEDPGSTVTVNGASVASGEASEAVSLAQSINTITVVVTAQDGVTTETYTMVVTRQTVEQFAQQAYIKASNAEGFTQEPPYAYDSGDRFGGVIALSGNTLAVGATGEDSAATGIDGDQSDNSASFPGAVYVFTRDTVGMWSQQAYIKASNTDSRDGFGESIALDGDTLVVGASGEDSAATGIDGDQSDNSMPGAGAAYVFVRDEAGQWTQQAYIKGSGTASEDSFGEWVALSGDTVAVAAWKDASVYVFTKDANETWSQQAYIKPNAGNGFQFFPWARASVALDGDTLAVGSPGTVGDGPDFRSGAVYVYGRDESGQWGSQTEIRGPIENECSDDGCAFGNAVSLDGDTLVVGAPLAHSWLGGVYVFTRDGGGSWTQQTELRASNTLGGRYTICEIGVDDWGDVFGSSVSISGDRLAVGAEGELSGATGINGDQSDNSQPGAGAVYLFIRDGDGIWTQQAYVKASNTDGEQFFEGVAEGPCPPGDNFGSSIAIDGDILVVAAEREESAATGVGGDQSDNSAGDAGAVYVFR